MNNKNVVNRLVGFTSRHTQSASTMRVVNILAAAILMAGLVFNIAPYQYSYAAGPFTVNTTNDTHCSGFSSQGSPSCGAVTDGSGHISLRSALEEASTAGGTTTINLPAGTYHLSLGDLAAGTGADTNITIHGAGSATTLINQTEAGRLVFVVNYNVNDNMVFNLDNVTVSGGSENENDPDGFGGNGGAILAGGSGIATGNSVSITSVDFPNNFCSPVANAGCSGGAINMTGGGDLTVANSTFSNNQAGRLANGSGGAIYFDNGGQPGNVSITNSVFTNNLTTGNSGGGQGGAVYLAGGSGTTYTLNNNTFTGNTAVLQGGAIYLSTGSLTGSFNRITGNTAAANGGSGIYVANNAGSHADMRNNWWGCNAGPGGAGCDASFPATNTTAPPGNGQITFNPWIILKTTASPTIINANGSSTLTASFLQNSAGGSLTTGNISQLIGLGVTWTNTVNGNLSGQQTTIQAGGAATATFTNPNNCSNGSTEAKVDNIQNGDSNATASITVQCPDLTAVKSNDVTGSTVFPTGWTWTIHIANGGLGSANFANGNTILSDNLPNSGLTNGAVAVSAGTGLTGTVNCAINGTQDLLCTASGAVSLAGGGSFDVTFTATPTQPGLFTNPRGGGSCQVDSGSAVTETNEANNTCSNNVAVNAPPTITSSNATTFTVGSAGTFTVTTHPGYPTATTLSESGALPGGVTYTDNGNGTATLAGTPAAGSGKSYTLNLTASNGILPNATQTFTLTVNEAPTIKTANHTTFTVGSAGTFSVTAGGWPKPALSASGALPSGVTFTDNGDGTATLAGTPAAGTGGAYPLTITASNGVGPDAVQSFTLNVDQAPAITSANAATFTVGTPGTFTVTTTGFPTAALSKSGGLPSGVTFSDNGNGTATLAGTPGAGTGGTYAITITASNGVGSDATQSFTLTVHQAPAVTSANSTTFTVGAAGTFTVTATGFPTTTLSKTGSLPAGVTFVDNGNNTATLAGTSGAGTGGTYPLIITASNGVGVDATQSFTLTVDQAPAITSATATSFIELVSGTFTVTTTGFPTGASITISKSGSLPTSVTFTDNHDGTATLAGIPALGTNGSYPLTITASNGVTPDATQSFTLTVLHGLVITSADHTTFTVGSSGTFTVTTAASTTPALSKTGALPGGVSFTDNGDGTATLSGTPAASTGGTYPITITAHNGVSPDAVQSFTLTVGQAPAIISANAATFTVGTPGTFTVITTGFPAAALSKSGGLPGGVSFTDNGNGTATLAGTPGAGTGGTYAITITASNGTAPDATQGFTLTIHQAPAVTSANNTTFTVGAVGTFTVNATGFPTTVLSKTGSLPAGVTFVDNGNNTASLAGTPGAGTGGTYPIIITASNGVGVDATQSFTLTVDQVPAITSANSASFVVGVTGSFNVTTTGFPTGASMAISDSGALPSGVTFTDNGDGTASLGGIPAAGTAGSYPLKLTAHNGVGSDATQNFTLTVNNALSFSSANSVTFTVGSAGTFTVTTGGTPLPSISETGALPVGVTLTDNHDGTATLSGTPALGTAAVYPLTLKATNGLSPDATQNFTLTVSKAVSSLQLGLVPNPSVFGQPVTFTATITSTAGTPTGTVQFSVDGSSFGAPVTLTSGVGSLSTGSLAVGMHAIAVVYSGDGNFTPGAGASGQQQVDKASTTIVISIDFGPSVFGKPIAPKAVVSAVAPGAGKPTGTVSFFDGANLIGTGTLDANGVVILPPVTVTNGNHSITATYSGDSNFTGSTQTSQILIPWRLLLTMVFNQFNP